MKTRKHVNHQFSVYNSSMFTHLMCCSLSKVSAWSLGTRSTTEQRFQAALIPSCISSSRAEAWCPHILPLYSTDKVSASFSWLSDDAKLLRSGTNPLSLHYSKPVSSSTVFKIYIFKQHTTITLAIPTKRHTVQSMCSIWSKQASFKCVI